MEDINLENVHTAVEVRGALVACFVMAHKESMEIENIDDEMSFAMAREIVKKAFKKNGDDFEKPNKASLTRAVVYLQDFSAAFRESEVIKKHASEMMEIINQLDD